MDLCIQVVCNPGVPEITWSPHRDAFYHYCMIMVYPYRNVALVFFLNKCMNFVYCMINIYEGIQTKNSLMSFPSIHYHLIKTCMFWLKITNISCNEYN